MRSRAPRCFKSNRKNLLMPLSAMEDQELSTSEVLVVGSFLLSLIPSVCTDRGCFPLRSDEFMKQFQVSLHSAVGTPWSASRRQFRSQPRHKKLPLQF